MDGPARSSAVIPGKPARVGIVTSSFLPLSGGAEKQCSALAAGLERRNQLSWVLTQHIDSESSRVATLDNIIVHRVGLIAHWRRLRSALGHSGGVDDETTYEKVLSYRGLALWLHWLKRTVLQVVLSGEAIVFLWRQRKSVGVVVCFFCSPLEAVVCRLGRILGIPVVVRSANSREYLFQDLVARWQKASLLSADRLIAISTDIRRQLLSLGVQESQIRFIPNGVDIPPEQWTDRDHLHAAGCVANLSQQPLKGLDVLVEAWALVAKDYPTARLVIYGRGSSASLIRLADALGVQDKIDFAGSVRDVGTRLLEAGMFVLPSRVEGMSNALLEAMSLGMPCIATAVSGNVDLIQTGRNGLLVQPGDPNSLALAIVKLLRSPAIRAQFGRAARESIERNFTTEIMISNYQNVLAEFDQRFVRSVPTTNSGVRVTQR